MCWQQGCWCSDIGEPINNLTKIKPYKYFHYFDFSLRKKHKSAQNDSFYKPYINHKKQAYKLLQFP